MMPSLGPVFGPRQVEETATVDLERGGADLTQNELLPAKPPCAQGLSKSPKSSLEEWSQRFEDDKRKYNLTSKAFC